MKKYIILLLLFGLSSCDVDSQIERTPLKVSEITGSWQIVSESYSIGGPQIISKVENGPIYNFRLDGTFDYVNQMKPSESYSGSYNFKKENILILKFVREGEDGYLNLKITLKDGLLTWFPVAPSICTEGCSTTLKSRK